MGSYSDILDYFSWIYHPKKHFLYKKELKIYYFMTEQLIIFAMQRQCSIFMQPTIRLVLIHVLALSEVVKMNLSKKADDLIG